MYYRDESKVFGLTVQVHRTHSPSTPDSQSEVSGLSVLVRNTPSFTT